ncbi:MAG: hypothetical protein QG596_1544 [Actinomycetota bacterium]|jgi:hypothetical protein|nr:hypothetical protein [Actinomycetota bacterium]
MAEGDTLVRLARNPEDPSSASRFAPFAFRPSLGTGSGDRAGRPFWVTVVVHTTTRVTQKCRFKVIQKCSFGLRQRWEGPSG